MENVFSAIVEAIKNNMRLTPEDLGRLNEISNLDDLSKYLEGVQSSKEEIASSEVAVEDKEFGGLKTGSSGIFNLYKDISEVAKDLVRDMAYRGYFRESDKKKRAYSAEGLIMSDEQAQVGALSIGPALSTLFMELKQIKDDALFDVLQQSAFELIETQKGAKKSAVSKDKDLTILGAIKYSLLQLIAECYREGDEEGERKRSAIIFEASPFYKERDDSDGADVDNVKWPKTDEIFKIKNKQKKFDDCTCDVGGYLDTASWVFVVAQMARDFLDRVINLSIIKLNKEAAESKVEGAEEQTPSAVEGTNDNARDDILTYDTIWTLPETFTDDEKKAFANTTTSDVRDILNRLYMASLRFACRCIVYDKTVVKVSSKRKFDENVSEEDAQEVTLYPYKGWMFTIGKGKNGEKPTFEPDLYMSYAASTMYLGLYKEYAIKINDPRFPLLNGKNVLDELRLLENYLDVAKRIDSNTYNAQCETIGIKNSNYFECFYHDNRAEGIDKLKQYVNALCTEIVLPSKDRANVIFNSDVFNAVEKKDVEAVHREIEQFLQYLETALAESKSNVLSDIEFLFYAINGEQPLLSENRSINYVESNKKTPIYTILKEAAIASARYFWDGNGERSFKNNMALGPCYSDGTLAVEDSYIRAGHSNVLFNNLFVIGLIVNSAYDVEILKTSADDYNDMMQAFQIAVQDTQRRYNEMSRNHTVYKVNSFMLDFSEQVDEEAGKIASRLRRVNIAGCYLLPILFKTNGIIEDYLIQYPRSEMVSSFKTIIANRKKKKNAGKDENAFYWVWDKEGYNAISNYYYVDALIAFYRYYDTYERPFTLKEREINDRIAENWVRYAKDLEEKEIQYNSRLKKESEEIEKKFLPLEQELTRFKLWRAAICDFIVGGIAQSLNKTLSNSIDIFNKNWVDDGNQGAIPIERLMKFVANGEENGERGVDLASMVSWFTKLQLMTMLNSKWNLGISESDNARKFQSNISDKLMDDVEAKKLLEMALKKLIN